MTLDDELLSALERLSGELPEERVGQLIVNVATISRPPTPIRAIEATDRELRDSAIRRSAILELKVSPEPSELRKEIFRLIRKCWPREEPLGRWISEFAKKSGWTLIHVSDDQLVEVLRTEQAP